MGSARFSAFPALLLAAAVYAPLPRLVLGDHSFVGSDFAETAQGFDLQDLQQERVCRRPTLVPSELTAPLASSPPPPPPNQKSRFDVAVVIQRHGSRRSMLLDTAPKPFYGKTHPGQLFPQGAYELHVAGIEMRRYLMNSLGLSPNRVVTGNPSAKSPDTVYRRTLGVDLTDDCRTTEVNAALCTLPNLVLSVGAQIPSEAVYARSSAYPRTEWSTLMFLEGFYGLPFGCVGTVEELDKTQGGRTKDVCLRRTVCDSLNERREWSDTLREECTSRRLPCVHTSPVAEDGLMSGATTSRQAYADATAYYESKGAKRSYETQDPRIKEALGIAADVFGEEVLGKGLSWMAGEMAFSELAAGAARPLAKLATWVEEQKQRCEDPAAMCDPRQVPTYESLVDDLLRAYKEGTDVQYADGQFSRYVASPAVGLQNALFRFKAFGRDEDWEHLQNMLHVLGGFEGLRQEAAVEKLQMLLIGFHDFLLLGLMELLQIEHGGLLPFALRLTFELSHSEAQTAHRDARTRGGNSAPEGTHECRSIRGESVDDSAEGEQCSWPETSHVVRVLMGRPGGILHPVALPWCDNAVACPLHKWLAYTYERVQGHWFFNVASTFHRKYTEAHGWVTGLSN